MRDRARDHGHDAIDVRHHLCVAETDHVITFIAQETRTLRVLMSFACVIIAIHFDDQAWPMRAEIHVIWAERNLSTKSGERESLA